MLPFLIRTEAPDLVLMDVEMPAVEGDKAVEILGVGGQSSGPLVYLYSDRPRDELERRAEACKANGFIQKGGDFDQLAGAIRSALRR